MEIELRLYEELNDHLPVGKRTFARTVRTGATPASVLRSLGVPVELVDLLLVNGESAELGHPLADGDRVTAYPVFESLDLGRTSRLPGRPLRQLRFAVDGDLPALAGALKDRGYPVRCPGDRGDARRLVQEGWILISRSRELIDAAGGGRAYRVRSGGLAGQLDEIVRRFQLDLTP